MIGGGVVPGSLTLVGGEPGVGKSTLLLQLAGMLTQAAPSSGRAGSKDDAAGTAAATAGRAQDVQQDEGGAAQQEEHEEAGDGSRRTVLYVSGEESVEQLGSRAERMGLAANTDVFVYSGE